MTRNMRRLLRLKGLLAQHSARYKFCLGIILLTIIALLAFPSSAAQAADPVKLELGGDGATPWSITDIKPGFSGTKTVTLKNTGYRSGIVYIWITDIVSSEGLPNPESETGDTDEPGELDRYLLLGLTATGLDTTMTLPALISAFPADVNDTYYIKIGPLAPGQTVTLTWNWQLPPEVGNDVQSDRLSFTIKYTLVELPSPPDGGGGGRGLWEVVFPLIPVQPPEMPGIVAEEPDCPDVSCGSVLQLQLEIINLGLNDAEDVVVIYELPEELIVTSIEPVGLATFTKHRIYATLGKIDSGKSKVINITVSCSCEWVAVAPNTPIRRLLDKASLAVYDSAKACPQDMYKLNISKLNIKPFVKRFWLVFPLVYKVGEGVDITATATNICEAWRYNAVVRIKGNVCHTREIAHPDAGDEKDDYTVTLKINSAVRQTKQVSLAKGASLELAFAREYVQPQGWQFPGRLSSVWWVIPTGKHFVDINGLEGKFTSELRFNWLLILIIIAAVALIIRWLYRTRKRRPSGSAGTTAIKP